MRSRPLAGAPGAAARLIGARPDELGAALAGAGYGFCMMAAYYMLRPVRDAMGIAGGVENLKYLFLLSFSATLLVVPLYGWACTHVSRSRFVPWVSLVMVAMVAAFFAVFSETGDEPPAWVAQAFFVWVGVFNLFVLSVYWSFMADVLSPEQAGRLFGFLAAGGSAGAVAGPATTTLLAGRFGIDSLLLCAGVLLLATVALVRYLLHWERVSPASPHKPLSGPMQTDEPIGGNPLAGISLLAGSRYLLGIGLFVLLFTAVGTFMYMQQAELLRDTVATSAERTRVLATVDLTVNALCIPFQIFVTGRLVARFGLTAVLLVVPVFMIGGFLALAAAPGLMLLIAVQVLRRAGDYAITRPARELLFTALPKESRFKAKNVIDTVIYRGGDAANAWLYALLASAGLGLAGTAAAGVVIATVWAGVAWRLGSQFSRVVEPQGRPVPGRGLPAQDHDEPV
ncbi:MAG: MFS transporter [Gammaproteobacteria bacterium]